MRGEFIYQWPQERDLSSVKRRRRTATPWDLSSRETCIARARRSDRSMSCLVSESIIENRVRGEPGGRRRERRGRRARGGKRSGSLLETLVERCLTGTCCWWHTNEYLPLLSAVCTLARPRCSSRVLFLLLLLRSGPFVAHATSSPSPLPLRAVALVCSRFTSRFFHTRGSEKDSSR